MCSPNLTVMRFVVTELLQEYFVNLYRLIFREAPFRAFVLEDEWTKLNRIW